jgi:hypothetical protein
MLQFDVIAGPDRLEGELGVIVGHIRFPGDALCRPSRSQAVVSGQVLSQTAPYPIFVL